MDRCIVYGIRFPNGQFVEIPKAQSNLKSSHFFRVRVKKDFGNATLHVLRGENAKKYRQFINDFGVFLDFYTSKL